MSFRVAIVGAGLSGLSTAYFLRQHSIPSLLIEKSGRIGGLIKTDSMDGCRLEAGPDSYLAAKPAATELARELGLKVIGSNDSSRRVYIVKAGNLVSLPSGMVFMVPGLWGPALRSPLFSTRTKVRLLSELRSKPRLRTGDISVGELVRDHFGPEMLEYVAEPLLSGVYGGSAAQLSAQSVLPRFVEYERKYGSLIRAVQQERRTPVSGSLFLSLQDGMQSLVEAIGEKTDANRVFEEAVEIQRGTPGWQVKTGQSSFEADAVVLTCPAYASARLLKRVDNQLSAELEGIPYSSAILLTLLYDADQFPRRLSGFGFLVPKRERQTIAAATFVHIKFPERMAPGLAAIRVFIVEQEAEELLAASDHQLVRLVRNDLSRLLKLHTAPRSTTIYRWPRSMPQYIIGHERRLTNIQSRLEGLENLYLVGNAYEGVGIPDCIRLAKDAAAKIAARRQIKSA